MATASQASKSSIGEMLKFQKGSRALLPGNPSQPAKKGKTKKFIYTGPFYQCGHYTLCGGVTWRGASVKPGDVVVVDTRPVRKRMQEPSPSSISSTSNSATAVSSSTTTTASSILSSASSRTTTSSCATAPSSSVQAGAESSSSSSSSASSSASSSTTMASSSSSLFSSPSLATTSCPILATPSSPSSSSCSPTSTVASTSPAQTTTRTAVPSNFAPSSSTSSSTMQPSSEIGENALVDIAWDALPETTLEQHQHVGCVAAVAVKVCHSTILSYLLLFHPNNSINPLSFHQCCKYVRTTTTLPDAYRDRRLFAESSAWMMERMKEYATEEAAEKAAAEAREEATRRARETETRKNLEVQIEQLKQEIEGKDELIEKKDAKIGTLKESVKKWRAKAKHKRDDEEEEEEEEEEEKRASKKQKKGGKHKPEQSEAAVTAAASTGKNLQQQQQQPNQLALALASMLAGSNPTLAGFAALQLASAQATRSAGLPTASPLTLQPQQQPQQQQQLQQSQQQQQQQQQQGLFNMYTPAGAQMPSSSAASSSTPTQYMQPPPYSTPSSSSSAVPTSAFPLGFPSLPFIPVPVQMPARAAPTTKKTKHEAKSKKYHWHRCKSGEEDGDEEAEEEQEEDE